MNGVEDRAGNGKAATESNLLQTSGSDQGPVLVVFNGIYCQSSSALSLLKTFIVYRQEVRVSELHYTSQRAVIHIFSVTIPHS